MSKKVFIVLLSVCLILLYGPAVFSDTDPVVFSQKGGMLVPGDNQVYLRTNDEWTGFSTFYLGYRRGLADIVNPAVEIAASPIPHVYLANLLLYFKLFESENKRLFIGARTRTGYRYQDSDFSGEKWERIVNENYLTLKRNGILLAFDLTVALRFGTEKRFAVYYTLYPRIDIDFENEKDRVHVLFSPVVIGLEFRFRHYRMWSFAIEAGYAFPLPFDSIPKGQWVNFPSLANMGIYYRF